MSQKGESTIVSRARSAIVRFAHNIRPRTPECPYHPLARFTSNAGFTKESPGPELRRLKGEDGNNLIEYALVFMLFMSMVLGIVDFSRALYTYHFLSNAAREATRYASVRGSTCNDDSSCSAATPDIGPAGPGNRVVQDYVATIVPPGIDSSKVTVQPNWLVQASSPPICNTTINAPGCTVVVQVSYNFTFVVPFIRSTSLPLSSSSEMIIVH
jgi:Flp pilus assembly protein TadG